MKRLIASALLSTALAAGATTSDSITMRREADAFLRATPQEAQARQRDAVLKAVKGDRRPLEEIRRSRRPSFTVSASVDTLTIDGRHILFRPKTATPTTPLLVYLHGGGWAFGSPASAARFCDSIASTGAAAVLDVDYPLSPETSEDALPSWLTWLAAKAHTVALENCLNRGRIFIGGDSAGGYMALLGALLVPEAYAGVLPIYPVVTTAPVDDFSWREYGTGYANNADLMTAFYRAWQAGNHHSGTPTRLDECPDSLLATLPKVHMIAAERDVLRDSGCAFAERLKKAGVKVERTELPGTVHLFITVPGQPAAFSHSVEETIEFISR